MFTRDLPAQAQSFRAHADPLAGMDFIGGVVIVLRQVLDEITFRTGQIFMCNGTEHTVSLYQFLKMLCYLLEQ
ncbi:MAG TPA: hypothetical protein VHG71_04715 [Verrucomicrobiae bacterium]|nr:hypothetical protein [Verrucomicrobiae bacterium]